MLPPKWLQGNKIIDMVTLVTPFLTVRELLDLCKALLRVVWQVLKIAALSTLQKVLLVLPIS